MTKIDVDKLINIYNKHFNTNYTYKSLIAKATSINHKNFSNKVYIRGILEFSNYCMRDCEYCGIRKSNKDVNRYRMSIDEIVTQAKEIYNKGISTIVLQSGEDSFFTDDKLIDIISKIKSIDEEQIRITLSIGEKSNKTYKKLLDAGVNRFLLRFETCNKALFDSLHSDGDFCNRIRCYKSMKQMGYEIGSGFMFGLPGQVEQDIFADILYLQELKPHMIGVGPFIAAEGTPLDGKDSTSVEVAKVVFAMLRLTNPFANIASTTALDSLKNGLRNEIVKTMANVWMISGTPASYKEKYNLYKNKINIDNSVLDVINDLSLQDINVVWKAPGDSVIFKGVKY